MTSITHTSFYNVTCKICTVIRNAIIAFFVAAIALGESAGRARAARELANMGRLKEAKALMLRKDKEDV
jgi:hypothetical protein